MIHTYDPHLPASDLLPVPTRNDTCTANSSRVVEKQAEARADLGINCVSYNMITQDMSVAMGFQ